MKDKIPVRINKGKRNERMIGMLYTTKKIFVKVVYESRHLKKEQDNKAQIFCARRFWDAYERKVNSDENLRRLSELGVF